MSTSSEPPSTNPVDHDKLGHSCEHGCEHECEHGCEHECEHGCEHENEPELDEHEEETEFDAAPTVTAPAPDEITELCAQCVEYVRRSVGLVLDFTPETLSILDHYLGLMRTANEERPALLSLVANAAGAYFGELVRQRIDGFWLMPSPDVYDWYVCGRTVYLKFNPIGIVHEVIAQSTNHVGPGGEFKLARDDERLIAERLAAVPPVSAEHYYLLSTRLEAIDIVVETLRFVANQGGQEQVYESEDYE